jgi:hypothetical protein
MLGCRPSLAPGVDDPIDVAGVRHSSVSLGDRKRPAAWPRSMACPLSELDSWDGAVCYSEPNSIGSFVLRIQAGPGGMAGLLETRNCWPGPGGSYFSQRCMKWSLSGRNWMLLPTSLVAFHACSRYENFEPLTPQQHGQHASSDIALVLTIRLYYAPFCWKRSSAQKGAHWQSGAP